MNNHRNKLLTLLLFAFSVASWEALVRVFAVPSYMLPPPSAVALALWDGLSSGLYLKHAAYTLTETVLGFLIGAVLGLFLGTIIAINRYADYFLYPYIVMFQSLPKVALAPLIVLWFGLGMSSKVISAAIIAFFPLMINTIVGLRSADEDRLNLMAALGASKLQTFWYLRLPNALPYVMAGLDVAIILSLIGAIVGEFVGAQAGLGMLIQSMNFNMDVSGQFSILLLLSAIGLVLNRIIMSIRRRILFWDPSEKLREQTRHL